MRRRTMLAVGFVGERVEQLVGEQAMSDIVPRLRKRAEGFRGYSETHHGFGSDLIDVAEEAADYINRLRKERDAETQRLTEQVRVLRKCGGAVMNAGSLMQECINSLDGQLSMEDGSTVRSAFDSMRAALAATEES